MLLRNTSKFGVIILGQGLLAIAGFVVIPLIAQTVTPSVYGRFSLFLILLVALGNLDFGRALFTKLLPHNQNVKLYCLSKNLAITNYLNIFIVTVITLVVSSSFLGFQTGFGTSITIMVYCMAAPSFALQSLKGDVHKAILFRNITQILAFIGVFLGFKHFGTNFLYWIPFLISNIFLLIMYNNQIKVPLLIIEANNGEGNLAHMITKGLQIIIFNLSSIVLYAFSRSLLHNNISEAQFGKASAQVDIGLRLNMLPTAIANFIYPVFVRRNSKVSVEKTENSLRLGLVLLHLITAPFFLIAIIYSDTIIKILFGDNYVFEYNLFSLALIAVFVGFSGFFVVPWERAKGRFNNSALFYGITALLIIGVSLWLIPLYGIIGFMVATLLARLGAVIMFFNLLVDSSRPLKSGLQITTMTLVFGTVIYEGLIHAGPWS